MRIDYLIDHPDVEAAIRAENRKFVRQFSLERTIIKMEKMLKDVSKAKK